MSEPYKNWPLAVLIAIDQLGNAIAGGHPDATISARVGYFSENAKRGRAYWKSLQWIIDFAFYPIDGPNHCYEAWQADKDELFQRGSDLMRFILSFIIVIVCPVIAVVLRIAVLIWPSLSFKSTSS